MKPPANRHGPNKLTNYLETHDTIMGQFVTRGFIASDDLTFAPYGDGQFIIHGKLHCLGGIEVDVLKTLTIVDGEGANVRVRTTDYSYNARVRGVGNIFRYNSPHPDHNEFHHKHTFDTFAPGCPEGELIDGDGDWPTLGDAVAELEAWYYENASRLNGDSHSG